jgi:hypothetical protein
MWQSIRRAAVVGTAFFLLAGSSLQARPVHKQALADYFGPFLAKNLNDCRTCHLPDPPGQNHDGLESEKPHNPFGARLKAVREELRLAGKKTTIAARLEAIALEDSDGDGVPNLIELLSGHNPGDPLDKPTAAEVAAANQTLIAFRKARNAYPWTPFETVQRATVPKVRNTAWVRNAVDAFIAAEHEERGLTPRPEATKPVLLRRVYLDLIGLPPTPAELHAFLEDPAADAYERVVDRLLASPQYGERWGRHWMDIWRYSDWAGYGKQVRDSQPHIWRWRDWIIESLNSDKGYDRMILEMLAGDELTPEDPNILRATGYLVRNYKLLSREKWMQDVVDHTAQAFLGVTLGCARCHDHMYDPIRQKEYYQVRAIFEPHQVRIDRLPGELDTAKDGLARAYEAKPEAATFLYLRGDDRTPDKTPLDPGVPELLGGRFPTIEPVPLPPAAYVPDKRDFVVRETLAASQASIPKAHAAAARPRRLALAAVGYLLLEGQPLRVTVRLATAMKAFEAALLAEEDAILAELKHQALDAAVRAEQLEDAGLKASAAWETTAREASQLQKQLAVREARRQLAASHQAERTAPAKTRAEAVKKAADAEKAFTQAEAEAKKPVTTAYAKRPVTVYPTTSTGRRLAFARWIADPENPLTARVAMNHIWLRHLGQAIVPSVFDFGRNGRPPSHPALLDWLAAEFMECGWSMKAMHRLLVTSSTYRLASTPDPASSALDRDNTYLWRLPSRRVEAEVVRDCIFYVAGQLDPALGGPDLELQLGLTTPRRSLYFRHAAEKQMEFLKLFDAPEVTECYQRKESVMPQQALALANSELTLKQARLLARTLAAQVGDDTAAFVAAAFERVLSRPPTADERSECVTFLQQRSRRYDQDKSGALATDDREGRTPAPDPALRARENLVHVLLNHHDFVTLR